MFYFVSRLKINKVILYDLKMFYIDVWRTEFTLRTQHRYAKIVSPNG